jgi:predicted ATPase
VLGVSPFLMAERTAFVGRESEGSAIRTVIDYARTGQGSIVMLWDGPGVGKTRLAMEMAGYASRTGFRCSVGHCYERDEPYPYLPFAEIIESNLAQAASLDDYRGQMGPYAAEIAQIAPSLRRIFPDLPKPLELPVAQQRGFLFQSFSEALARAARTRPQLLVFEDLHWADESTLALLIYLSNRVAQLPAVIIGTYRSGYSDINPALVRTLEELIRMGVRPQRLGGLSKDSVAKMLQGLSQREAPESLLSLIYEESQGYPFFVEEVYRNLIEDGKVFDAAGQYRTDLKLDESDVPENVRLIISHRLERLDESEKRAITAAAVIGRSFSFQLLTAISQIDVDELFSVIEKAQQMGIIVPSSEGPERPFTFRHELVRQTLLVGISAPRRQQLHAAVAEAIERLYPGAANQHAGEIADHLLKAGSFADRKRLVRWLTLAGKGALEAAAFEEARHIFRSALSHRDAVVPRERADLLASLAMAEQGLERWDSVFANLRETLDIYVNLGDRDMVGRIFNELTSAFNRSGRFEEATETARRGLAHLEADVSADRARLLASLAQAQSNAARYEQAHEALREVGSVASEVHPAGARRAWSAQSASRGIPRNFRFPPNWLCRCMLV